jgi:hypothetical protein
MRRVLRLLTLWLFALALPVQGAAAATAMPARAGTPSHAMAMPDGTPMDAADMPCHGHGLDKAGCGACCGPLLTQQARLAVAPAAVRWAKAPRRAAHAAAPLFLTSGTDRPPRARFA